MNILKEQHKRPFKINNKIRLEDSDWGQPHCNRAHALYSQWIQTKLSLNVTNQARTQLSKPKGPLEK